ncbi:toprim domain-containing protein (plasmid) [Paenibacillus sp. JNUCC32]|uniref:toprim domain-containing protein n=1 Tax=Paenibacillus sp. JNUCC32 TaxID=2777984 RepID=UPI0017883538|nr:toprim domain-containing protein [Paenibacillus sp. JNUCC-32]QOT13684.1 toprim domain-containing protein [Paenibacillus sp. JNUCC-32]
MNIPIDVRAELELFEWERATWTHDRLIAVSPFRYDRTPSFYVYTADTADAKSGYWGDPGARDPEWQRGGIVKLLAFLRNETPAETLEYLRDKYGEDTSANSDGLPQLKPLRLTQETARRYRPLDSAILDHYKWRHPYLGERSISEPVQRLMRIGFDRERNAVVIPWFNPDGSLGAIKYRRVDTKVFWYERGGRPIRDMLYGIDVVYARRLRKVALVEAEVDAMTLMSAGIPAIATGGATSWNAGKRDMIARSPIEEVVILRDVDAAGRQWRNRIVADLRGSVGVSIAIVPSYVKDANELARIKGLTALNNSYKNAIYIDTLHRHVI